MEKKVTRSSKRAQSSSALSASKAASNQKLVLRVNSDEKTKKSSKRANSATRGAAKQKKKRDNFDAKKPKKPPTAFFYFLEDFRKEFQEQNPDVRSMRDIGKACGEKWKTMTYEEKVKYYDIATEKRAEFDRAMVDYVKRKESGEDQETEEDSEFDDYA